MTKLAITEIEHELNLILQQLMRESGSNHVRNFDKNLSLQRVGLDSLTRAEFMQRIEDAFTIQLSVDEFMRAENLQQIAKLVKQAKPSTIKRSNHLKDILQIDRTLANYRPEHANSLLDILVGYATAAPHKTHICFQHEDGSESLVSYAELLERASRVAAGLKHLGVKLNDTVAIMQPSHPNFFYAFFGILILGAIPVPIYPPFRMHALEAYAKTEAHILNSAGVKVLLTFDQAEKFSLLLKGFVPSLQHVTTVIDLLKFAPVQQIYPAVADDYGFIQYTSGSTNNPKGVLLTHSNLLANIRGYGKAIQVNSEDIAVSWLPLYHDMGLIGMWLGSLYHGVPLILMTPFSFLNRPERWLWTIHYHRGTLSGGPNFAYELCNRKIDESLIEGLDLSSWRMAANGAEKVYSQTLIDFNSKFSRFGLAPTTLKPMYGLAESSVALTIPDMNKPFHVDYVNREKLEAERIAEIDSSKQALAFVACGKPLAKHAIRIVNDENIELPNRRVGNLQFKGPSSLQGYYNNPAATEAIFHDGWWDTGDLAYIADDELYITGRRKDLIIKAGKNIYPLEIEEVVGRVEGVRQGCVVAFGSSDEARASEQIVVVAETKLRNANEQQQLANAIKKAMSSELEFVADQVVLVKPQTVPKTSSGKLQRAQCKKLFENGQLQGKKMPPWVQLVKLVFASWGQRIKQFFLKTAKTVYTLYVALLLALTLPVILSLIYFSNRDQAARHCKSWAKLLLWLAGCALEVHQNEKIYHDKPVIFAANHASYIDALIMLAVLPETTRFVGKKEIFSVPVLKYFVKKLDCIAVDRVDLSKGTEDTGKIETTLKAGFPVLIFPEGTFGYAPGLRPFRLGAFKVAVDYAIAVCPLAVSGTRQILRDGEWLLKPHRVRIQVLPLITPAGQTWQAVTETRDQVREAIAKHCNEPTLDFIAAAVQAPAKAR